MSSRDSVVWGTLDHWRPTAFLAAGGLFFASPLAKALVLFTDGPLPEMVVAILAFSGLTAALVGLLGFYPALAAHVPRHALAGVVTTVIATGVTVGVFLWLLGTRLLSRMAVVAAPTAPPALAFVSLIVVLAGTFAVNGTACLRAAVPSRAVGGLLLALAVPWVVLVSVGAVYGSELPAWISLPTYGAVPLGFLLTGYVLRRHDAVANQQPFGADLTTE